MAKVSLRAGASFDVLTHDELTSALEEHEARLRAPFNAVDDIRMPVLTGTAASGVLSMGGDTAPEHTPGNGYVWSIRHLVIQGMTRGATPDVIQIFRGQLIVWELNGNQYAQTFGRGEIMLNEGETLGYKSFGTFNATGQIIVHGLAWEAPAQHVAVFGAGAR